MAKNKKIVPVKQREYNFKAGNKEWQIRSKHGRDKIFASPELMMEAANEYFEWCDKNPFYKAELFVYKGYANTIDVPVKRPYTREGLNCYIGTDSSYFRTFKSVNKEKKDELSVGFLAVIRQIEERIDNQQFSGAAAGFFNANIIARKLGLVDKVATEHSGEIKIPTININKPTPQK